LLAGLEAKVIREGEDSQKAFNEFSGWCEDRARNLKHEIKTGESDKEELQAHIAREVSAVGTEQAKLEELAAGISADEADLKAATSIRGNEAKDAAEADQENTLIISSLERAIGILEREMRKGDNSFVQFHGSQGALGAIQALVDASYLQYAEASKLTALVQASGGEEDGNDGFVAPEAEAYTGRSKNIIDVLEDLLDKSQEQLKDARNKETNSKHNFEMLQQQLSDEIKFAKKELGEARKRLAAAQGGKASAEGDLTNVAKELSVDKSTQSTLKQDCMSKSQDFEAEVKSRGEELKALKDARAVIAEEAGGASDITYGAASLLQLASEQSTKLHNEADLANFEAVRFVKELGQREHSEALVQLARRMASAMRAAGSSGQDPFAKVQGLIRDMLGKLEQDQQSETSHNAYCEEQLGETLTKKADKEAVRDKLSAQIDSADAKSVKLKGEVADHQAALADLAKSSAELTAIRTKEKAQFDQDKPELEAGLAAVKRASQILREYYSTAQDAAAHATADGASKSIIGMLEVVEADLAKGIAEISTAESNSESVYEQQTQANKIETATVQQSVKYKGKSASQLDTSSGEAKSDREGVHAELSAIEDYNGNLLKMCSAKAEPYEERKQRREAELAGLKEALSILNGEAVLLQQRAASHRVSVHMRKSLLKVRTASA